MPRGWQFQRDSQCGERELKIQLMLESFEEGICSMSSIKMNRLLNHDQLGSPHAISIVAVLISLSCTHSAFQQQMPRCFCSSLLPLPLPWDVH
jgi:hypothetical protein